MRGKKKLHFDTPVKFCAVKLSDVQARGGRLEASVFDFGCINATNLIKSCRYGFTKLIGGKSDVKRAWHAPRFKRNYVSKKSAVAVPFLGSSEMLDVRPVALKYLSRDMAENLNLFVEKGTVLISCSGTIGNVSFVNETLSRFALSQHVIKISCEKFGGYIYACLKSNAVQLQIQAQIYGAVIPELEPEHLAEIFIPDAPDDFKQKIHELIVRSYELRDESNALLDEAEAILLDELALPPIEDFGREKIFTVKLSKLDSRLDASFHAPIVEKIIAHLKAHAAEVTTVADERISNAVILAGVFKRTYVDKNFGYPFLGGKEITELNPKVEKYLSKAVHKERYEKELRVSENMLLVTDRGTIGKVALVPKHWEDYAVSQNVLKVIPASSDIVGYLYVYLNSEIGEVLIKRETYGSVVDMIDDKSLSAVPVPLLKDTAAQEKINALALSANEKRFEAYRLERTALKLLDEILT